METLARAGFPSLNRWSAETVGRIAYALTVASATWVLAAANVLLDRSERTSPMLVRGGGALLFVILPFVLARLAIPKNRSPLFADAGRQHLISIGVGIVSIVVIQTMVFGLSRVVEPPQYEGTNVIGISGIMLVLAAVVIIPLAPIVQFSNDIRSADDHAPRMRWRIGVALAANMVIRALVCFLVIEIPSEYMSPDECLVFGSTYGVTAVIFAIALLDVGKSVYVLARTKSWIERARAGKITGVRVRDGEGEELKSAPQLLHLEPSTDIALVETEPLDATYRTAPLALPLGIIPAR